MITAKIYEDKNNDMVAVILEDGQCSNYIPCPEITALEADSFLAEAQLGFPEALPYEYDILVGLTMKKAAAREEQESTLIAQVDDKSVTIYPLRMSQEHQEFFQIELGDDVWQDLLERASSSDSVKLAL